MKRRLERDYPQLVMHSSSNKESVVLYHPTAVCRSSEDESDFQSTDENTLTTTGSVSPLRI